MSCTGRYCTPQICFLLLSVLSSQKRFSHVLLFSSTHSECNLVFKAFTTSYKLRNTTQASRCDRCSNRDSRANGNDSWHGTPTRGPHSASDARWRKSTIERRSGYDLHSRSWHMRLSRSVSYPLNLPGMEEVAQTFGDMTTAAHYVGDSVRWWLNWPPLSSHQTLKTVFIIVDAFAADVTVIGTFYGDVMHLMVVRSVLSENKKYDKTKMRMGRWQL